MRKFLLSVPPVILLLGCSVESRVKDKVWEAQLEKLKSPSTAKLVKADVYPEISEQIRKGLFLRQSYALQCCFSQRSKLDHYGLYYGNIGSIKEKIPKTRFIEFLSQIKTACPSGEKWINAMESNEWKSPSDSDKNFFKVKSKKEKDEITKTIDTIIQELVKINLETYEKSKTTVSCFTVYIKFDAQNGYGAMIRETATYNVLKIGERFRMIEKEQDDFVDSLMGIEEQKK